MTATKIQPHMWIALFLSTILLVCAIVTFSFLYKNNEKANKQSVPHIPAGAIEAYYHVLRTEILDELTDIDPGLFMKLHNPSSSEWKAFQWLITTTYDDSSSAEVEKESTPLTSTNNIIQRFAMAATYIAFDIFPPLNAHEQQHECNWIGAECDDGIIKSLDWKDTKLLSGTTIPPSLAYLTSLEILDITNHNMKGSIPSICYSAWPNLTELHIGENQFTRLFTAKNGEDNDISQWTQLEVLNAYNNKLDETIPSTISKLSNIRQFDLRGNTKLSGPFMEYAFPNYWPNIESIQIEITSISGTIPDISNGDTSAVLKNLKTLVLSNTEISGTLLPEFLSYATNLEILKLGLGRTNWTGGTLPESYSQLTNLRQLSLVDLKGITGTLPDSWGMLQYLTQLDLYNNPLLSGTIPTTWGHMTSLVAMRLANTAIYGTIPSELGLLTSLRSLQLYRTELTGTMPEEICRLRDDDGLLESLVADCRSSDDNTFDAKVQCTCCTACVRS